MGWITVEAGDVVVHTKGQKIYLVGGDIIRVPPGTKFTVHSVTDKGTILVHPNGSKSKWSSRLPSYFFKLDTNVNNEADDGYVLEV